MTHEQRVKKSWTTVVSRRQQEPLTYELDGVEFQVRPDLDPFILISAVVNVAKAMQQLRGLVTIEGMDISTVDDATLERIVSGVDELGTVQSMIRNYIIGFVTPETRVDLEGVIGNVGLHEGMEIIREIRDELSPMDPTRPSSSADGSPPPGIDTTDTAQNEASTPAP